MKAIIEITSKGYTKTLVMSDGTKHVQEWKRDMWGFATKDNTVHWRDIGLEEELEEAMDEMNHELGDISKALKKAMRKETPEEPWI